ncbi:MAG: hypothetical protein KIS65_00540 [Nitrosomonas sp.]|nr:hypothetical protein [Nitrosomonas sp.]
MNRMGRDLTVFAVSICLSINLVFSQVLTDDYINTINVRMDAQVGMFEQDGMLTIANGPVTDFPYYRDGVLTIPRVDTDEQPGAFLDGVFILDANSNSWQLQEFKSAELTPTSGRSIYFLQPDDGVAIHITDSFPVQVFLNIRGHLSNGCVALRGIHQRLKNGRFEITVNAVSMVPNDGSVACTQALVPFERVVPLQVYGLPRGIYSYIVNGEIEGSFELTEDNTL